MNFVMAIPNCVLMCIAVRAQAEDVYRAMLTRATEAGEMISSNITPITLADSAMWAAIAFYTPFTYFSFYFWLQA